MHIWYETERLILRPLLHGAPRADDVDEILALHTDPAVMRYLGAPIESAERIHRQWLPQVDALREQGLGYFATIEKSTGDFLGWFLLRPFDEGQVELGYRLRTAAWGRGRYVRTFHEQYDHPVAGVEHGEVQYALSRARWLAAAPGP